MTALRKATMSEIEAAAVAALGRYLAGEDTAGALREVAEALVSARAQFITNEGDPDWTGRTHAYRGWVRDVYTRAHVPAEAYTTVQTAVRYHVNNVLHEVLDAETIASLGLRASSSRERSAETRAKRTARLDLVGAGPAITEEGDVIELARLVRLALRRVAPGTVRRMKAAPRRSAEAAFAEIAEQAKALAGGAGTKGRV